VIVLFAAGIAKFLLYSSAGLTVVQAGTDGGISIGLLAAAAWGLLLVVKAYPTRVGAQLYAFAFAGLFAACATLLDSTLLKWTLSGETDYLLWLPHTLWVRFFLALLCFGWIASLFSLQLRLEKLEAEFRQQSDAATLLKDAELFKLRQQLQPHFLYNSLNSINALILIQPDKAQEMIGKLSDFLRSSVRRESTDLIAIDDEIAYIEAYLAIETIRFGDRLKIEFIKEYTDDSLIPPFLVQPLLENAVKFGLYGKTGAVTINIQFSLDDSMLIIKVINPFDATLKPPAGTGFGLEGIRRRLYLLYARTDLLETGQEGENFITTIKIPQLHV
jgi:two-component system LytT family sensor kinase